MYKCKYILPVQVLLVSIVFCFATPGFCLEPAEILVVANRKMEGSVDLAYYYMDQRSIPRSNFLELSLTLSETMTREEYDHTLKKDVLDIIDSLRPRNRIAAIVLIYGVPLKVAPPTPNGDDLKRIRQA